MPLPRVLDKPADVPHLAGIKAAQPPSVEDLLSPFDDDALLLEEPLPRTDIFIPRLLSSSVPTPQWGLPLPAHALTTSLKPRPTRSKFWGATGLSLLLVVVTAASALLWL